MTHQSDTGSAYNPSCLHSPIEFRMGGVTGLTFSEESCWASERCVNANQLHAKPSNLGGLGVFGKSATEAIRV